MLFFFAISLGTLFKMKSNESGQITIIPKPEFKVIFGGESLTKPLRLESRSDHHLRVTVPGGLVAIISPSMS